MNQKRRPVFWKKHTDKISVVVTLNKSLAYLGLAGLIAASILNVWSRMRQRA
jgi:hypothetical protein